jgi:peptidoglycan/xylan/chitin deacetylase (PgdA/CDA1 family)
LPTMARAFGVGAPGSMGRMLYESIRFYWFIGLAISGMGVVVAPGLVRLFYGAQYEGAIPAVVLHLLVAGFVLILAAFNAYQTASDRQGDRIRIAGMTLAVNVVAAFALVPPFGLYGALASAGITKIALVAISWRFVRRGERDVMPVAPMLRVLAAATLAVVLGRCCEALVPGRFGFVAGGVMFASGYIVLSAILKSWTRADYQLVAEVSRKFGNTGERVARRIDAVSKLFAEGSKRVSTGKRERVGGIADSTGLLRVAGAVRSSVVKDLRVLAYHRVLNEVDESGFAFDKELVSARRMEFDWQMAYVAQHFTVVSCQQVADAIDSGKPLPRRAIMVTFDDGFLDNYEVAFPVLRQRGIPAVFFLSTGYIDSERLFWFDWLVHVLLKTNVREIRLDALDYTIQLGPSDASRRLEAIKLLRRLKRVPEATRLEILDRLNEAAQVEVQSSDRAQSSPMTWDHVREMSDAGMEFGSHTVSHPILSSISDPAALRRELEDSKATIERETGNPVIALAYPVGGRDAFNKDVAAATAKAGYRIAFTYQPGSNALSVRGRFSLKRIAVERYTSRSMFKAALQMPEVFA